MERGRKDPNNFRFFMNSKKINPIIFNLIAQDGGLNLDAFHALAGKGITTIFNSLERLSDFFWSEAVKFEQALDAVATIDAIGSFGTVPGLEGHYDIRDLIIVQVSGRKRWNIHGSPLDAPWRNRSVPAPAEVTADFVMNPGDVLFVPAGLYHRCFPLESSLHVGVLIRHPCGADLLDMMKDEWEKDAGLGSRLHLDLAGADLAQQEAVLKEALIRLVSDTDMTALTRRWLDRKQRRDCSGLLKP